MVFLWWLVAAAAPLFASVPDVSADTLMARLFSRRAEGLYNIGELFGNLYVKQRVKVDRKNLALNAFSDMARFDSDARDYVTELFYQLAALFCCDEFGNLHRINKHLDFR